MKFTKRFYKEKGIWYIDLPEFLEAGLGTKANLMMVAGADTMLDILSNDGDDIVVTFADEASDDAQHTLIKQRIGLDMQLLQAIGHAPVDYGAYYDWKENNDQSVWLCPVTEYVFQGGYPNSIYVSVSK
tara:strand:- start:186 stop:572 length:387 start_codon:yes stop_codon:yes gene_type:complete